MQSIMKHEILLNTCLPTLQKDTSASLIALRPTTTSKKKHILRSCVNRSTTLLIVPDLQKF